MLWAPSRALGSWGLENVSANSAALRTGGALGVLSVFRQPELLLDTSFLIQSQKRRELPLVYTWMSNPLLSSFFFFSISLSFTTGNPGQFQGSYGKFLRCDKDSLGFCSIDFYETVDGCKIRVGTVQWAA